MSLKIGFRGAAGNVTGSRTLLTAGDTRVLVDCGMFQERDFLARNWDPFLTEPSELTAVVLTHAHIDHCGLLPRLVKQGFRGPIYCTRPTAEIAGIVLADSAHLQQEDLAFKRQRHRRENRTSPYPYEPLYDEDDIADTLALMHPTPYEAPFAIADNMQATLRNAGHILGSSMIAFQLRDGERERSVIFSCDIGRRNSPILQDPSEPLQADYIAVESTYGDRVHESNASIPERLAEIVRQTHEAGGNVVIPSFAVERTQELLYHLGRLRREKAIPDLPVFVDSPMATRVTELFRKFPDLYDNETRRMIEHGQAPFDFPGLKLCRTVAESKAINQTPGTAIIIAGSGMCVGGRVKHHLVHNIGRPESVVLFVGYQAFGTLGRRILEKPPAVRIHGEERQVKARIERIFGFSAHADREELLTWMSGVTPPPRRVFVVHGEKKAAESFAQLIRDRQKWPATVPASGDDFDLE
jgi:metallo-beta-lactamase family protein